VVTKLDRLARDTIDMLELVREIGAKGDAFKSLAESWTEPPRPPASSSSPSWPASPS